MPESGPRESSESCKEELCESADQADGNDSAPEVSTDPDPAGSVPPLQNERTGLSETGEASEKPHPGDTLSGKRKRVSWSLFLGQNVGERAGVIAAITGVLALVVSLLAWLLPQSGDRSSAVPEQYLGTWRGQVTMTFPDPTREGKEAGTDEITIKQGSVGDTVADQRAVDWGQEAGCSRSWQLAEVNGDHLVLKAGTTGAPANAPSGQTCLADLTMSVRLTGQERMEIQANYTILGTVTGAFSGSLVRQSRT
ncbi:hypothetical protein [Streptosporangium sp. NPDC049376]|uniref:hypothetical protein n=1 Tax=Streptosporangium sp. NPDC049376 TaxID=3366192 RepID=UPI0037B5430E